MTGRMTRRMDGKDDPKLVLHGCADTPTPVPHPLPPSFSGSSPRDDDDAPWQQQSVPHSSSHEDDASVNPSP